VLDDHDRRRGHVDTDLDHRGRNQEVDLVAGKTGHRSVLLVCLHAAVHQADAARHE
jgi:hypothetical protein